MTIPDPYGQPSGSPAPGPADPTQPASSGYGPSYPPPTQPYPGAPAQPGYGPQAYGAPGYPPGATPAAPYGVDAYGRPLSDKSKVVAGVLGIALGSFGAGRFYLGDTRTGVLQLVVSFITCGLGHIWGLVDGIMILVNGGVDGQGRILRD